MLWNIGLALLQTWEQSLSSITKQLGTSFNVNIKNKDGSSWELQFIWNSIILCVNKSFSTPKADCFRKYENKLFFLSKFHVLSAKLSTYCIECNCCCLFVIGLFSVNFAFFCCSLCSIFWFLLKYVGTMHWWISCGVNWQVHQSQPKAWCQTMQNGDCVIGLTLENHNA